MKKIIFTACLLVLALATALIGSAASFVDVPADAYYAEAAQRMADKGVLGGVGDGYFQGDISITRAQMAVVAIRLLDKEAEAKTLAGDTVFNDVLAVHGWATGYINYAVANKIFVGDGDGNFRPDDFVKYEEAVKVIVCALGLDKDVKIDPTDWSKEYIEAAQKANLLNGLICKKGEAMLRSDIAVICDASVTMLEAAEETTAITTPEKVVTGGSNTGSVKPKPSTTTQTPADTTAPEATTASSADENELPFTPAETEATTTAGKGDNETSRVPLETEATTTFNGPGPNTGSPSGWD